MPPEDMISTDRDGEHEHSERPEVLVWRGFFDRVE